jgi:hypothetical protein
MAALSTDDSFRRFLRGLADRKLDNDKFRQLTELMKKSVPVISGNFLERIAEPASRFHPDYLAYRNREITWAELVARLPHVAMIGDSVCTGVYVSSVLSTFWRARTCCGNNWFLDSDLSPASIRSVSKRLEEFSPVVAIMRGIGVVDDEGSSGIFRRFSDPISTESQFAAAERFPG